MGKLQIKCYKGLHTVEYNSPSLGCTLFASWDKQLAEIEYNKFVGMSETELEEYLLNI